MMMTNDDIYDIDWGFAILDYTFQKNLFQK